MDKSIDLENPGFGQWRNMTEWFQEATAITEKPPNAAVTGTIPVPGKWQVTIRIQARIPVDNSSCGEAMKTAMALLAGLGLRPEDAYLQPKGYLVVSLKPADFYEARQLAEQVQSGLLNMGIKTTVGNHVYREQKGGNALAYVGFSQSMDVVPPPGNWLIEVMMPQNEGTQLASEIGLTAAEGGQRMGGYQFTFNANSFATAKAKAIGAIAWLSGRGHSVQTSWGDIDVPLDELDEETLRSLNETGDSFYKWNEFRQSNHARVMLTDRNHIRRHGELGWFGRLKRLLARLAGSAGTTTVKLNRAQVRALLDLVGEFSAEYSFFCQLIQGDLQDGYHVSGQEVEQLHYAEKAEGSLAEIVEELRNALLR